MCFGCINGPFYDIYQKKFDLPLREDVTKMSVLPKPSFLTATAQIVPNILKPAAPACVQQKTFLVQKHKEGFLKLPKAAITACNSLSGLYSGPAGLGNLGKSRSKLSFKCATTLDIGRLAFPS